MSTSETPVRTNEIAQASRFLNDPRIQNTPLEAKENFLRSKGLTDAEIRQAMSQVIFPAQAVALRAEGSSIWGLVGSLGGFVAAMATGAFLYDMWMQKTREEISCSQSVESPPQLVEEILKTLKEMAVRQEQRQAEHARMLKDLTTAVAELRTERTMNRKVGGSVILSRSSSAQEKLQDSDLFDNRVVSAKIEDERIADEVRSPVLERIANELKKHPSRPTVIMILQNLVSHFEDERFRRINLSSARFKEKIGQGVPLEVLKAAGFVLENNALCFSKEKKLEAVSDVLKILEEVVDSE